MPNFLAVKTSRKHYDVTKKKMQTLVLSTQKNPYLNQATPKKSFDHPCHVQSKVPPLRLVNRHNLIFMCKKPGQCFAEG